MVEAKPIAAWKRSKSLRAPTPLRALCFCGMVVLLYFAHSRWVVPQMEEEFRRLSEPRHGAEAMRLIVENDYATRVKTISGTIHEASAWYWEASTFNGSAICWSYECPSSEA